jgi:beta-fructofuranosidase
MVSETANAPNGAAGQAAAERRRLSADPHRPLYHFLPPANWMNDPNGLIQWRGQYHMFYQCNPYHPYFGDMHWGHAVSPDLVHWNDLPIALEPTPGAADHFDCFSGCAVDAAGVPTLVYTGISEYPTGHRNRYPVPLTAQVQCIATGDDELLTWRRYAGNPVITAPAELDLVGFRDPFVWREKGRWQALVGAGIRGVGGSVLRYRSDDLRRWDYAGPLVSSGQIESGEMWECPNFFPRGEQHVLIVSSYPPRAVRHLTGAYDGNAFTPRSKGLLHGEGCFYAPQTFRDARGRRLMFGWLPEGRTIDAQRRAGWAGVMSLPQVLSPGPSGGPWVEPAPEVDTLRKQNWQWRGSLTRETPAAWLNEVQGDCLEIILRVEQSPDAGVWGLTLRRSPDGVEETRIEYEPVSRLLRIDRQRASLDPETDRSDATLVLDGSENAVRELRVFLDRSVIEVYTGGRCLTSRIYPTRLDSLGVGLIHDAASLSIRALDIWTLGRIWPASTETKSD